MSRTARRSAYDPVRRVRFGAARRGLRGCGWEYWGLRGCVIAAASWAARQRSKWSRRQWAKHVRREGKLVARIEAGL